MAYSQDDLKRQLAKYVMKFVRDHKIIGVGTGSTVNYFIEELAKVKSSIEATVSSSKATTVLLKKYGLPVFDLNHVPLLPVYIDGADEALKYGQLIKGRGGALLQEKVLAASSQQFICMIDESKLSQRLSKAPVPVEVVPSARGLAARHLVALGGDPIYREHYLTDNGNIILDVERLNLANPVEIEEKINNIPGVVCAGIFAKNLADILVVASQDGIIEYP